VDAFAEENRRLEEEKRHMALEQLALRSALDRAMWSRVLGSERGEAGLVEEGLQMQRKGDLKGAIARFQKAVEMDPADYEAQNALAIALLRGGGSVGGSGATDLLSTTAERGGTEKGGAGHFGVWGGLPVKERTDGTAGGCGAEAGLDEGAGERAETNKDAGSGPSAQVLLQMARLRERFLASIS